MHFMTRARGWDFLGDTLCITVLAAAYAYHQPSWLGLGIPVWTLLVAAAVTHAAVGVLLMKAPTRLVGRFFALFRIFASSPSWTTLRERKKELWTHAGALVVRCIFLPLMLVAVSSFAVDFTAFTQNFSVSKEEIFHIVIAVLFFIDVSVFAAAYLFESTLFQNTVTSVDANPLSWLVTLACYPPLIFLTGKVFGQPFGLEAATENALWWYGANGLILIFTTLYVWATLSLGMHAGNLTNKGIVASGVYAYVRHPAYVTKVAAYWIALTPLMGWTTLVSLLSITTLYYLRAITEEQHLAHDPEYLNYQSMVPHRFIPRVW